MNSETVDPTIPRAFPVVAIGAADGGPEAVSGLVEALPASTGMAFAYMQTTDGLSLEEVAALLKSRTEMPVVVAEEAGAVKPDHIYLVPPAEGLKISGGVFVADGDGTGASALHINRFFSSVAETHADIAIGVLLSGGDSDGAAGLKAIKMSGGITFTQNDTALFGSMPRAAVAEGAADFVLSPADIAREIGKLAAQKETFYSVIDELNEGAISNRDESLLSILRLLTRTTGVDFGQYKMNTVKRRIIRRMMLFKLETLKDYAGYLRQHTPEIHLLYQDLLINVTTFFRDAESSEYLQKNVLPRLIKGKESAEAVRIWVPACSTGQEPYSLAMLVMETLGENAAGTPIQIFATDLSESAVNKARIGMYTRDEVAGLSPARLQRFFQKIDGSYRIIKAIRDLCIFATHNIAKDPPFSRLDLISCCNLLIYLDVHLQKKLIATFHYSLLPSGHLILGKSETVGSSSYLFGQVEKRFKIYAKKRDTSAKAMFEMNYHRHDADRATSASRRPADVKKGTDEVDLENAVDLTLLKRFTPASVLVNADLDILQFRGSTGLYLEPSPGKASLNLLKMARPGLGFELRNAVHKAKKSGGPVRKEGLEVTIDGKTHVISVEAIPIKGDGDENYFLVVFEDTASHPAEVSAGGARDGRIQQLEAELTALREDMRSIVEAQEAANEELQSANEEIVSSNEELQSINEELETSKEEIESSNEELITINQELQMRNEQLAETQEYSDAVFTTIRESLLIVDRDLRVKTANAAFYKTFLLREEETQGRLLYDIGGGQWNIRALRDLLGQVLAHYTPFNGYEIRHHFSGIGDKVLLLNVRSVIQKIHGQQLILIAIEDITEHKEAQRIIAERETWFRNMADNAPVMIWLAGVDRLCTFVNQRFSAFRGEAVEEAIGKPWHDGAHPDDEPVCAGLYDESFRDKKPFEITYRLRHHSGGYRAILNHAKPNFDGAGNFLGYIGSCVEAPKEK